MTPEQIAEMVSKKLEEILKAHIDGLTETDEQKAAKAKEEVEKKAKEEVEKKAKEEAEKKAKEEAEKKAKGGDDKDAVIKSMEAKIEMLVKQVETLSKSKDEVDAKKKQAAITETIQKAAADITKEIVEKLTKNTPKSVISEDEEATSESIDGFVKGIGKTDQIDEKEANELTDEVNRLGERLTKKQVFMRDKLSKHIGAALQKSADTRGMTKQDEDDEDDE